MGTPATPAAAVTAAELMPLGVSMRDAMVEDLRALPGVAVSVADCAQAPITRAGLNVLRADPHEDPLSFIARQARAHDAVWVVAPESDQLLARCRDAAVHAAGTGAWIGCTGEAIRRVSSKRRTMVRLAAHGLETPLSFVGADDVRRWVVKPDDGAGAVATHVHPELATAQDEAERRRAAGEAISLQPWVEGEALSLSLLVGGGPTELLSVNRQHIEVDAQGMVRFRGVSRLQGAPWDARCEALQAVAHATVQAMPGLGGFVGIDLVWHPARGPVVIEVNPRVSCAYAGLSAHLGRNLAADILVRHGWSRAALLTAPQPETLAAPEIACPP